MLTDKIFNFPLYITHSMCYVNIMNSSNHLSRKERARKTRNRIVFEATKLFARQGYHKTTIADICSAVGLTSGALFHYFPTKEALLNAVIERLRRGIVLYSEYLDSISYSNFDAVEEMVNLMCDHFERQPEATICLASLATEFAGGHHRIEMRLKEVYEDFVNSLTRVFNTHPGVENPRAAAIAFIGASQGVAVQGLLREGEVTIRELARGFLSILQKW